MTLEENDNSIHSEVSRILNPPIKTSLATQIGHFATAELSEDTIFSPEVEKINPVQRSFIALQVRGFSVAAACRQLNVNYQAALRWTRQPWYDPACEEERSKWFLSQGIDKKTEFIAPLMPMAMEAIRSSLTSEDEKVRMAAVELVFRQFFDDNKGPGRPRKDKPEEEKPLDLSEIRAMGQARIEALKSSIRGENETIDIRANAS